MLLEDMLLEVEAVVAAIAELANARVISAKKM
jgi:hypothetical protein